MSRFVLNPGVPTAIGGAGEYTLEIITPGGIAFFSDDQSQMFVDTTGQAQGGWPLTSDKGSVRRGPYSALYAIAVGNPVTIEAILHSARQSPITGGGARGQGFETYGAGDNDFAGGNQRTYAPAPPTLAQRIQAWWMSRKPVLLIAALLVASGARAQTLNQYGPVLNLNIGINTLNTITSPAGGVYFIDGSVPPQTQSVIFVFENKAASTINVTPFFNNTSGSYFYTDFNFPPTLGSGGGFVAGEVHESFPEKPCSLLSPQNGNTTLFRNGIGTLFSVDGLVGIQMVDCPAPITGSFQFEFQLPAQVTNLAIKVIALPVSYTQPVPSNMGLCGGIWIGNFCQYGPQALGLSTVDLPPLGNTVLSIVIDTRGVKQLTFYGQCTQLATPFIDQYEEDGATPLFNRGPVTAADTTIIFHMGSESLFASNDTTTPAANDLMFPQRALSFGFTNSTNNDGTCAARIFLAY
jgi:hypothetical protein